MRYRAVAAVVMLGVVGVLGCASPPFRAGAPTGAVDVIAHRGASAYAPENTRAAFELAIDMGADWFELDCHLSGDGEIVVIHDPTVDRTTDGSGAVAGMTLGELQALDAGSWFGDEFEGERIPTLGEALDLARGRIGVYVELKSVDRDRQLMQHLLAVGEGRDSLIPRQSARVLDLIEASRSANYALATRAVDLIRERDMKDQVVIQSFSPVIVAVVRAIDPRIRVEFLGTYDPEDRAAWALFLRWGQLMNPHGFNPNYHNITEEQVRMFQDAGRTVNVWTVNDAEDIERMANMGVDGIITDYPDVAVDVLSGMGLR